MASEDELELQPEQHEQYMVAFKWSSKKKCLSITIAILIISLVVAVVAVIGLAAGLGVTKSSTSQAPTVCLTPECVQLASQIMSGVDETIDPCQDFYNFSCGRWADNNYVPSDVDNFGAFDVLKRKNSRALYEALTHVDSDDIEAVKKAKDLFRVCMNFNLTNALGIEPLLNLLKETGGWPLVNLPGDGTPWDIDGTQFQMEKLLGSPAFATVSVSVDDMNSSHYIITVQQSGLSLEYPYKYQRSILSDTQYVDKLRQFIVMMLSALHPSGDETTFTAAANGIIQVETALAGIFEDGLEVYDAYNKMTLTELAELSYYYDWVGGLQALFASAGVTIDANEPVNVRTPVYLSQIGSTLEAFNPVDLQNYARWQLVQKLSRAADEECVAAYYKFKNATTTNEIPDRSGMCIDMFERTLPFALWRSFVDDVLSEEAKSTASEMTTNVMAAFRERVGTRDWLDEETRQRCQNKVDHMKPHIAYPEGLLSDDYLNKIYKDFQVFPNNLFQTFLGYLRLSVRQELARLPNSYDILAEYPDPYEVNAFNYFYTNEIVILPGILNAPYFEADWPLYSLYGALGAVIGHEITHGFDSTGRLYNETGQYETWWTNASIANFVHRAQCYVNQYSDYSLYGINILGNQTLGENIADNGGIAASYQAYRKVVDQRGQDPLLPSITYTRDQLFFIGYAQNWCTYYNSEGFQEEILIDEHSPGPFRVIGALSNSPEFAEAFQCAPGTPMNPQNKCTLW